uniref:Uncharacterized protein n=1 Tax=Caenorhabditis japonica TaxID=281687 RepID=A0A8R1I519_CAEJA
MARSAEYAAKALERKKRFMAQAKKNNIFKARRRNNFAKRYPFNNQANQQQNQHQQKQDSKAFRQRGFFQVLPTDDIPQIPECSHGPCLLFKKNKNGLEAEETFFACAIYRNQADFCDFKRQYNVETGEINQLEGEGEEQEKKKKKKKIFGYNRIPKALSEMKPTDTVLYCKDCINVFPNKHECVCEPVERDVLARPTTILPPVDEQHGESQFFFSDESLNVILKAVEKSKSDGVLCIGAPRIFENVRALFPEKNSKKKLHALSFPYFFGCVSTRHYNSENTVFQHLQVTYEGHKLYRYSEKTIVRLFTNLPFECIDLKDVSGYKFCNVCDRYVTERNVHCERCDSCTSVEQGKWNHCELCDKCVKPRYVHCAQCARCHLYGRCIQKTPDTCC